MRSKNSLLVVIILLSLLVLAWRFGVPLLRSGQVPEDLKLLREKVGASRSRLQQKDRLVEEIYRLTETVSVWESHFYRLPPESIVAELVATLDRLAEESGLNVREKRLHRRMQALENWRKVGVTISGRGEFEGLIRFLDGLLQEEKIILVEKIHLSADQRSGLLSYQITLTTLTGLTGREGMD